MLLLRLGFAHLCFPMHLQPMLLQLLRVNGLLRALVLALGTAFAAIGTITTITAASTATAAVTASTPMLLAFLRRGVAIAILRARIGSLRLPLLLRRTRRALVRTTLALRALVRLPLGLGQFALLLNLALRTLALRAIVAWLLLLRRTLVAALLIAPFVAVAALLAVAPAAAFAAPVLVAIA